LIHALKFGVPLIPHTLGGLFMTTSSMFIITNILGLTETGIYVVGLQIGSIISILADAFNRAYAPWLFSKLNLNDESVKIKIVKFTYFYFFCIIFISLILGVSAPLIVDVLLGKSFQASSEVIIWIALGSAFKGMYYMVVNYIFYVYKTYFLTWITFFNGIINIPLTILLTKINGVIGASQAYCMILLLMFIMTWILSSKVYKMPWDLRRI
ncbi:MAG: oligosaccharide flippase family protein, partial [Candidatus Aenigmatarchaeota archaeon]